MQVKIFPSSLHGAVQAPASKSSMQRACAAALVSKSKCIIHNPGHSKDDQAAIGILKESGCLCTAEKDQLLIDSSRSVLTPSFSRKDVPLSVHCGESGLGIRMFTPILALSGQPVLINGEGSLMTRPMDFFDEMLPRLGVEVVSNHGRLPLRINGPLQPQNIEMDGSLSSQFLTGLIYAFAASDVEDVTIRVHQLKSKPYIDLTLKVLSAFGLRVPQNRHYESFHFGTLPAGGSAPVHYRVEGDWSGGAFLLVAGAIGGHVTVSGLDTGSVQADRRILQALVDAGCDIRTSQNEICLSDPLVAGRPFEFDATDCPDLFPPLVALAAYCQGTTSLRGTSRLAHKESNRALTLQEEFAKLGVEIDLKGDQMLIRGGSGVRSATVRSHHDHRIAMACTVTALKAQGAVTLEEAEAVDKSYPDFYGHLKYLGAQLTDDRVTNHQNHTL